MENLRKTNTKHNALDITTKESIIWSNVLAFAISWAIWLPFQNSTIYYNQLFLIALGATPFVISIIASVNNIILSFSRIIGGYLSDKFGRVKWINSMTLLIAFTYLINALAPSWEWYFLSAILSSLALFYQPAINAILSDSLPSHIRGRGISAIRFLNSVISLVSPFLAIWAVTTRGVLEGQRLLFLLAFISGIAAWLIRVFLLREVMRINIEARTIKNLSEYFSELKSEYVLTMRIFLQNARSYLVFVASNSFALGLFVLTQLYAVTFLAISLEEWGYIVFIRSLITTMMIIPAGIILDKFGRKVGLLILAISSVLQAIILSIATVNNAIICLIVYAVFAALGNSMLGNITFTITSDILPPNKRAKGFAISNFVFSILMSIGSIIGGYLFEYASPRMPYFLATIVCLIVLSSAITFKETIKISHRSKIEKGNFLS